MVLPLHAPRHASDRDLGQSGATGRDHRSTSIWATRITRFACGLERSIAALDDHLVSERLEVDPNQLWPEGVRQVVQALPVGQVWIARVLADGLVTSDDPPSCGQALGNGLVDGPGDLAGRQRGSPNEL